MQSRATQRSYHPLTENKYNVCSKICNIFLQKEVTLVVASLALGNPVSLSTQYGAHWTLEFSSLRRRGVLRSLMCSVTRTVWHQILAAHTTKRCSNTDSGLWEVGVWGKWYLKRAVPQLHSTETIPVSWQAHFCSLTGPSCVDKEC